LSGVSGSDVPKQEFGNQEKLNPLLTISTPKEKKPELVKA
jgi:hypothetical protein